jgi:aspartate ammonia-lyase
VVTQVCYAVIGNDLTITMAAEAGQLQLNAFEPIIARSLFDSVGQLTAACRVLPPAAYTGSLRTSQPWRSTSMTRSGLPPR